MLVCPAILLAGCQQSITSRLVGEWTGCPDTASAAAARSAKRKAQQQSEPDAIADAPTDAKATSELGKTELEQHDVTINMALAADKSARMSLGDGSEPLAGVWRVVTTLPPDGAEIEISLSHSNADPRPQEKRRFIIDFQQHNDETGFTLVEKGADPIFGRLYFVRQGATSGS